jgi:hypothetical protein
MIRETLPEGGFAQDQRVSNNGKGSGIVTAKERHERHGHRPAIFVVRSSSVAETLERELFNRGFETQLVLGDHASPAVLPPLLKALWSAGLVIVYASEAPGEEQAWLEAVAGESLFEVSLPAPTGSIRETVEQTIEAAESLRLSGDEQNEN